MPVGFFSGDVKCDWCGKYIKSVNSDLDNTGLGLIAYTHKHFCSRACKIAYKESKESKVSSATQDDKESKASSATQDDMAIVRADLDSIATVKFGETSDDISETLNMLFIKAANLPKGFEALGDSGVKQKKQALIEKIEFGIIRLNKVDAEMAGYFEKKFDEFTGKARAQMVSESSQKIMKGASNLFKKGISRLNSRLNNTEGKQE